MGKIRKRRRFIYGLDYDTALLDDFEYFCRLIVNAQKSLGNVTLSRIRVIKVLYAKNSVLEVLPYLIEFIYLEEGEARIEIPHYAKPLGLTLIAFNQELALFLRRKEVVNVRRKSF